MEVMLVAPYSKARKKSPYVTRSLCLTLKQPLKSASMQPADRNKFYHWKFYSTILASLMTTWKILLLAFLTLTRYLSLSDIRQISTCGVRTPKSQLMLKIYFNNIFGKASFQWWYCECSVKYKKGLNFHCSPPRMEILRQQFLWMVAHFSVTRLTWKSLGTFDFKAFEHFCAKEKEIVQQFGFGWRPVVYLGVGRKMGQLGKNLPIRVVKCEEQSKEWRRRRQSFLQQSLKFSLISSKTPVHSKVIFFVFHKANLDLA